MLSCSSTVTAMSSLNSDAQKLHLLKPFDFKRQFGKCFVVKKSVWKIFENETLNQKTLRTSFLCSCVEKEEIEITDTHSSKFISRIINCLHHLPIIKSTTIYSVFHNNKTTTIQHQQHHLLIILPTYLHHWTRINYLLLLLLPVLLLR